MNQNKVHSHDNVPFSWENKPGALKETSQQDIRQPYFQQKLPPPPCLQETAPTTSIHDIKISPPPCAFNSLSRSSRRGVKKSDDPFLAAYKECTKSASKIKLANRDGGGSGLKKGLFNFFCKDSCNVRNDSLVRISKLVLQKDKSDIGNCL